MEAPICLVENTDDGKFVARPDALKILASLNQPLIVVSVVGKYGSGKSYLLNRIADRHGFSVGSTAEAHTKGIWMWCVPHPHKHHRLLLLDTEGLGNIDSVVAETDTWICALAVLFSTVLVFNTMDIIDQPALKKLHNTIKLVTDIKEQIKASGTFGDCSWSFPNFVWAVRDFTLDLNINGNAVTSDQYFEHVLRKRGDSKRKTHFDLAVESFRKSFPERKCFVFASPSRKWKRRDHQDEEFDADCQKLCNYVYGVDRINTFPGNVCSSETFSTFVEDCVSLLNSGQISCPNKSAPPCSPDRNFKPAVPCNAIQSDYQSDRSISKMEGLHNGIGGQYQTIPDSHIIPAWTNTVACNESYNTGQYKREMEHWLLGPDPEYYEQNEESTEKYQNLLKSVFKSVDDKVKAGDYAVSGGYQNYIRDRNEMEERYRLESGNKMKANEVLEKYLKEKVSESQMVQMMDKIVADKERDLTALKERLALSEQEKRTLSQKLHEKQIRQLK